MSTHALPPRWTPDADLDGPPTWSSNATLAEVAARLRSARRVALVTHARPDGDAVGSTLALARALKRIGVRALPAYMGPWTHSFDEIIGDTETVRIGSWAQLPPGGVDPDLICVLDTGSWAQLTECRPWLEKHPERTIVIDHHLHGDPNVGTMRLINWSVAATCQPVAELCQTLLGVAEPAALPRDVAEPLYVGLATDTGWFRHSNVSPAVFSLAAGLLEAGADHTSLFEIIEQSDRPARLRLIGRALSGMDMHADDRVAVLAISRGDMEACGAEVEDTGGLSDLLLTVEKVQVAAVLTELEPRVTKVSLRSKALRRQGGAFVNVNDVAKTVGGGGHAQAAGAKIKAPIAEAKRRVVAAILEHFS